MVCLALLGICTASYAASPATAPVDLSYLRARHLWIDGDLISAQKVYDQRGEHVLVLSRKAGPSSTAPGSKRIERIALHAAYYSQRSSAWKEDWAVRDFVDCPGLDAAADFFTSELSVTDINNDGTAEVTIPYKLFCGGGVDSYTVKVILREGPLKLAIRGESEVRLPGQAPFGGGHQLDRPLLTQPYKLYREHLENVWRTVSIDTRK